MKATRKLERVAVLGLPLAAIGFASSAKAVTVLIDFGNDASFRGVSTPSPDSKGHYWTSNAPGNLSSNIPDINGATTALGVGWDTPVATDSFNGPAGATSFPHPSPTDIANAQAAINSPASQTALGNLAIAQAVIDFAASSSPGSPCVFDLQGLDPTQTYSLRLYGSHIFSANQQTTYTVGNGLNGSTFAVTGVEATASIDVDEIDTNDPSSPPNVPNTLQVAMLTGLVPSAGGQLFVNIAGAQGDLGYLNALELSSNTPEPSSLAVIGIGSAFLAKRRRR